MKKITLYVLILSAVACSNPKTVKTAENNNEINEASVRDTVHTIPLPVNGTTLTDGYLSQVAQSAYLWGWVMVNLKSRQLVFSRLPGPVLMGGILPVGPSNRLTMLTDYIDPMERAVACPNQDVVYGSAMLDLSKDAVVVQVPDFGDRFWVYQLVNQRTDGFAKLGKMYGTKPGAYLLTGPDWKGKVPASILGTFRSGTNLNFVIPRVFVADDPADKATALPAINGIMIYPLSEYDGKLKTTDWTKTQTFPAPPSGNEETQWVVPEKFWDIFPSVLKEVPPLPGEEALYAQFKFVCDAAMKDTVIKKKLIQYVKMANADIVTPLFQFNNIGYRVPYHWRTQSNGADFGYDYLTRTACGKANIFVNLPTETKYFYQDLDSSGKRLEGKNSYAITFAKDQFPPVKGFWSLTMYNQHHFFEPNSLKRYSVGTKSKQLKTNPDGSLTIYISGTSPGADKEDNWLPAPKNEPFSLYVRCYWPEEAALKESWTPPPVLRK